MANIFTQIEDEIWSLVETETNPLGVLVAAIGAGLPTPETWTVATHVVRVKSSSPREDVGQATDFAIVYAGAESDAPYYAGRSRLWTRRLKFDLALRANAFKIENLQDFILAFVDTVENCTTTLPSLIQVLDSVEVREFGAAEQPSDELRGSVTFVLKFERAT